MRKCKSWMDPAHSHDADWPPYQSASIMDLVAGARAVDWDFTTWRTQAGMMPPTQTPVSCSNACWLTRADPRAALA
jgi:hypothetical protein